MKALVLLSGGLDSRLAVKIMKQRLGAKNVEAVFFKLPFGSRYSKNFLDTKKFCKKEGIKLNVIDCTKGKLLDEYLKIVKKPKHGHGVELNPCIDCKIFMLKKARELAGNKIIATGDVLGQRPMSQHKGAFVLIERESGLKGKILRPLTDFFKIHGRSREKQMRLAKRFRISYPSPAGGCLLCEKGFCMKLKPLLKTAIKEIDIDLLKIGRHFKNSNIILGKNHKENKILEKTFKKHKTGILLEPKEPGPSAFVKDKKYISEAKKLIRKYSKHKIKTFSFQNLLK